MIRLRKAKPGSDHDCEYSFAHRVWQTSYRLFDFEVSQPMPCQSVHLKSFPFALHFYTFLKISLAGIYGLCINSIIHYYEILTYIINIAYFHICLITRDWYDRLKNTIWGAKPKVMLMEYIPLPSRCSPKYPSLGSNHGGHYIKI